MKQLLFKIISFLAHPLLLPFYALLILTLANPYAFSPQSACSFKFIALTSFINIIFFPLFSLFMLKNLNFIPNFKFNDRQSLILSHICVLFFYTWGYVVYFRSGCNSAISDVLQAAILCSTVSFVANAFSKKISLHALGLGALLAISIFACQLSALDFRKMVSFVIIFAGVVGTARLYLQKSSPRNLYQSFFTGFIIQFFSFVI